nr:hypothetical protein [Tanacetum cinerariifolium]
ARSSALFCGAKPVARDARGGAAARNGPLVHHHDNDLRESGGRLSAPGYAGCLGWGTSHHLGLGIWTGLLGRIGRSIGLPRCGRRCRRALGRNGASVGFS